MNDLYEASRGFAKAMTCKLTKYESTKAWRPKSNNYNQYGCNTLSDIEDELRVCQFDIISVERELREEYNPDVGYNGYYEVISELKGKETKLMKELSERQKYDSDESYRKAYDEQKRKENAAAEQEKYANLMKKMAIGSELSVREYDDLSKLSRKMGDNETADKCDRLANEKRQKEAQIAAARKAADDAKAEEAAARARKVADANDAAEKAENKMKNCWITFVVGAVLTVIAALIKVSFFPVVVIVLAVLLLIAIWSTIQYLSP